MKRLVIFIPAYNEEKTIGSVVGLAAKHGKVFVIDDGSGDRTAAIAKGSGAAVISHSRNRGYGAALRTAFRLAKKTDAGAYVFLDGDFQHDPEEIPRVAAPVLSGNVDVALGSRFLGSFVNPPPGRREGVRLLNEIAGLQAGNRAMDFQCGFRAFSKKAVSMLGVYDDGYDACSEVMVSALAKGLRIAEVPVSVRYHDGGGIAVWQGAGLLGRMLHAIFSRKPLLFFAGSGAVLMLLSGVLGYFVLDTFYAKKVLATGSAFLTVFFGIAGLVLILIGINLYTLEAILRKKERGEG